ncbi:MAG: hypothetical protein MOB07_01880 [Acidobacteria bacterium]|nr:hypothetical protein [Acidobacteriota bacterium]
MDSMLQLRSELDRLRSQNRKINVFFRDDDVDEDESSLRTLLNVFLRHEIPINLEIIPARMTDSAAALLLLHHSQRSDLFELNQHGWQHVNHEREGRKCEFGRSRSFDEQFADIASGKEVLEGAFGSAFSAVFTPPWNRCTTETFLALDQLEFQGLSKIRDRMPVTGYRFREISVTLDLYRWKSSVVMKTPEEFVGELISQMSELETIGIMLHHKVMDEAAFELLSLLLKEMDRSPVISFHTFQTLLKGT